jgi:hypothetical protein
MKKASLTDMKISCITDITGNFLGRKKDQNVAKGCIVNVKLQYNSCQKIKCITC